jgi:hypothetical protein
MSYRVGDPVKVMRRWSFFRWWPFGPFSTPRGDFSHGRPAASGTIVEVIEPSEERGITNTGGYKVQLKDGTLHYYSEAELRPARAKNE